MPDGVRQSALQPPIDCRATARLRPELADLPAYTPGQDRARGDQDRQQRDGRRPAPSVRAAIERATDAINRYPYNGYVELRERLAKYVKLRPRAHSVGLRVREPVPAVSPDHQHRRRRGALRLAQLRDLPATGRTAGATPIQVPLTDHAYDLDAMLSAVTDRTRLIFVCNPNNPTSTVVDPAALARFVAAVPADVLIALDEAYVEYIRDDMLPDSFGLVRAHRTWWCCGRSRRRTAWPVCGSATRLPIRT